MHYQVTVNGRPYYVEAINEHHLTTGLADRQVRVDNFMPVPAGQPRVFTIHGLWEYLTGVNPSVIRMAVGRADGPTIEDSLVEQFEPLLGAKGFAGHLRAAVVLSLESAMCAFDAAKGDRPDIDQAGVWHRLGVKHQEVEDACL